MTSQPSVAPHVRRNVAGARIAILLGVAAAFAPISARAELQVGGSPEAVSIDAQNSSIKEILAALGKSFDVHFQGSANLDKQLSGTYEGPLPRVLMRVLEGYNVIMKKNGKGGFDITVLGGAAPAAGAATAAAGSPGMVVASAAQTSPAPALNAGNVAQPQAVAAPAAPVTPPQGEAPLPGAPVMLAEGLTTPAVPSTSGAPSPDAQPSTVAPPTPSAGGGGAFPVGPPTVTSMPGGTTTGTAEAPAANPPSPGATAPTANGLAPTTPTK
jgi:hypothetical protein